MALDHDTMINPPIESLLGTVDSKFTLVTLAARRARNINSYFNQLGDGLGHMIPPQVSSVARKPLSIAFEERRLHRVVLEHHQGLEERLPRPDTAPLPNPGQGAPFVLALLYLPATRLLCEPYRKVVEARYPALAVDV